ncbi:ase inhibitor I13 potato inhibitor I [Micractinium conductrix]|uniref:Ase inhibitor I13 potato inhibitor I n=1 Tax=Micractinium conductrix TaxID=554055 RepID=A0A2P6VJQ0_9CHLO|nr:ase inhibitor I13 potato inhibitor I [Micractinium conductrix]|eukprot:PSC74319.1 ase inhibitor I13 potato inhibitor I [Micractinium conductrix]
MRTWLLLALVAAAAAVSGASFTDDADPEQKLTLPIFQEQGMANKMAWPELVGRTVADAKAALEAELPPNTQVFLVPTGSMMTMDFRTDRVRCIYDPDTSLIVAPPRIG